MGPRPASVLIAALISVLLGACGFHLRGAVDVPESLRTVFVTGDNPHSPIVMDVQRSMRASGVELTSSAQAAPYTVYISKEHEEKRSISVDRQAAAAEFQLRHYVSFELRDPKGHALVGPDQLIGERVFLNDITNVVGKRDEERLIREEMRRQLAAQIMRRYQALDADRLEQLQSQQADKG
ncbi:MAG: LPS assembly lipoprotein LptE [Pseudomonadales bacterium]